MKNQIIKLNFSSLKQAQDFSASKVKQGKYLAIKVPFSATTGETITLKLSGPKIPSKTIECLIRSHEAIGDATALLLEHPHLGRFLPESAPTQEDAALVSDSTMKLHIEVEKSEQRQLPLQPVVSREAVGTLDMGALEQEIKKRIDRLKSRLETVSALELFGVKNEKLTSRAHEFYLDAAYKIHPDRTLVTGNQALRRLASEVLADLNSAYQQVLKFDEKNKQHDLFSVPEEGWLISLDDTGAVHTPLPLWSVDSKSLFDEAPSTEERNRLFHDVNQALNKVESLIERNDLDEARRCLNKELIESPGDNRVRALLHVLQGQKAQVINHFETAILHYEAALSLNPECTPATQRMVACTEELIESKRKNEKT